VSLLTIGAVVAALSEEFPDISTSKIRYLERRGLVRPQRTAGGQRRYTEQDLTELRRIMRWQRDEYLPLAVIADQVAHGRTDDVDAIEHVPVSRLRRSPSQAMSDDEFCDRAGITAELLGELSRHGLIERRDVDSVTIAQAAAALAEYGIEPRHLRPFRTAADRDAALVEQAPAVRRKRGSRDAALHREAVAGLLALLLDLHVALVRARSTTLDL